MIDGKEKKYTLGVIIHVFPLICHWGSWISIPQSGDPSNNNHICNSSHLYSALAFAKSSHMLFILALNHTCASGICYPHFMDEEYETLVLSDLSMGDRAGVIARAAWCQNHSSHQHTTLRPHPLSLLVPLKQSDNIISFQQQSVRWILSLFFFFDECFQIKNCDYET